VSAIAIKWGAYEGSPGIRAGIDLTVSGTTITVKRYVGNQYAYNDNQVSVLSGADSDTKAFNNTYGAGTTTLIATTTRSGSSGSTYSFTHSIDDVFNGATPSVTDSITVGSQVSPPSAPGWVTGTPTSITQTSAFFDWNPPSDNGGASIQSYYFMVSLDSGFSDRTYSNTDAGTAETASGLDGNTTYYARVRAENSAGPGPWSSTRQFKTAPMVPNKVGGLALSAITSTTTELRWSTPSGNGAAVTSYDVQADNNSGFGSPVWNKVSPTELEVFTGLTRGTTYYTRVRATNSVGKSEWSVVKSWTTLPTIPGPPTNVNSTRVSDTTATVTWQAPADDGGESGLTYDVQYSTSASFGSGVVVQSSGNLTGLQPGTTYYTRVAAKNSVGRSSWSEPHSFSTLAAGGINVWTGSAWVNSPVYAYNGTAWVACDVLVYNGTAWVTAT
jgi:hypothetical protein